jgi:signal peptidase I
LKKALQWLGWALLAAILLTASFVMWGNENGWEFDAVLSGSMEPVYNVGGLVVIRPVDADTLQVGDVISFKLPGIDTPICHRIIDIQDRAGEKFFLTKGDANEDPDQDPVPLASVKGKAILHLPYIGRLAEVKNLGLTRVPVLGKQLPAATLVVLGMGLLFIGLTLKDTIEDMLWPHQKRRRQMLKKRDARLAKRRQVLGL